MAKLPTPWKPPAAMVEGRKPSRTPLRYCRMARFGRSGGEPRRPHFKWVANTGRRRRTGRTKAPKRGRARASGRSVEARNDAAIDRPEVRLEGGVRASIVPNRRRCGIGRRKEGEKAKLARGKGTQEVR